MVYKTLQLDEGITSNSKNTHLGTKYMFFSLFSKYIFIKCPLAKIISTGF